MWKSILKISFIIAFSIIIFSSAAFPIDLSLWKEYKRNFISNDGRIIDYQNGQISHSEGQGYGMLLSTIYNDKKTFDLVWKWTKDNLQVRKDKLFAWSWGRRPNGSWQVIDYNNATDGDILIAYALLKAFKKWKDEDYKKYAIEILKDIRKELCISWKGHMFLLPGYFGFKDKDFLILNPSYLILPAFKLFSKFENKKFWEKIYQDSVWLLSKARFGLLKLPSDWILLKEDGIFIHEEKSIYFGYNAVRVLLYLCIEKEKSLSSIGSRIIDIYKRFSYIPLWIDLVHDSFSLKDAPSGYYAIYARAAKSIGEESVSKKLFKIAEQKLSLDKKNYYFFSLYLLAKDWESEKDK